MRIAPTDELSSDLLAKLKSMLEVAYGEPFVEDWEHALGGVHFLVEENGEPLSHVAVVERWLETGGRLLKTGYVEAVATHPSAQGRGLASTLLEDVRDYITHEYDLGALGTGEFAFYERFDWVRWRGPTSVHMPTGETVATPDEDGFVMILRTLTTPTDLDITAPLSCDWRPGDVW